MAQDKLFLIAIGGTGMRCLESFVHLCAAGLFDNQTIDILTLDTDQNNGNKGRVEKLVDLYNNVKSNDNQTIGGEQRANTFFSAKLNLYKFHTDYTAPQRKTLYNLSQTNNLTKEQRADDQDLADLFFDPESVQKFRLDHGYRAQTHLGSMLMYHGIIEAARNAKKGGKDVQEHEKDLKEFLMLLNKNASNARVFVFGSVFGGTGASSIPVIPLALLEALKIVTGGTNILNFDKVKFGSTLLTEYFTFNPPSDQQKANEKVIADATHFSLNSQAALSFYSKDTTVKNSYKRLYHIGWPTSLRANFSEGHEGDVTTGGHDQCNDCHVAELFCAAAAYDFFNDANLDNVRQAEYVYRTVELTENGNLRLTGQSFLGKNGEIFENKLGAFLSLSHLLLSTYSGADENVIATKNFINELSDRQITGYETISDEQARQIDEYLQEFAYRYAGDEVRFGWIYQIYKSLKQGQFIFAPEAFKTNIKELCDIDPGTIFLDEQHHWLQKGNKLFNSPRARHLAYFLEQMAKDYNYPDDEQGVTVKEKFLAHLYNAITEAQGFGM